MTICFRFLLVFITVATISPFGTAKADSPPSDLIVEKRLKTNTSLCRLRFAWTDWPPYLVSGEQAPEGIQIDLINWIGAEMNCEIIYRKLKWAESLDAIENGTVDVLGRASKIASRESFALFSNPYRQDLLILTIRKGEGRKYQFGNIDQMFDRGFKLGILKGGYFGKEIEKYRSKPEFADNFVEFELESEILLALNNKEIDGIFESPFTIDHAVMANPLYNNFQEYPLEILIGESHFMFSKKTVSEHTLAQFNQALARVKQSDAYRQHWFWSTIK